MGCIILLCREPCKSQIELSKEEEDKEDINGKFEVENWQPLIENKCLQTWLVSEPP